MSAPDEALLDAITARAIEMNRQDDLPPPGPVTHFIVVAVTINPTDEEEDGVWLMMTNGTQPMWQNLGLLEAGKQSLLSGYRLGSD